MIVREDSTEFERKRDQLIAHLEAALVLADELKDGVTGLLINTALDQARADRVGGSPPAFASASLPPANGT